MPTTAELLAALPAYLRRGAELMARASKSKWVKQKKQNVFAHRLNFVLPSLLFRLKSRVNVPQLLREEDLEVE